MTYGALILVFCTLALLPWALLPAATSGPERLRGRTAVVMLTTLIVLCVLTVVFDSLIISAGFVEYGAGALSGIRLWHAPVEDLSYVLAGVLLLPGLWRDLEDPRRARDHLAMLVSTSRPVSWVNTAYPFAAAYLLTEHRVDDLLVVGTIFFLIPYNLLMYGINDVFDHESDLLNPRKGGLEGALVDPSRHRGILVASVVCPVPFVLYLLFSGDVVDAVTLAVSLFAVVAYSVKGLRFKEKPGLDSATSATHFVSPMIYGLVLADATWTWSTVAVTLAFFVWGMASQAFGAVQDVRADRAAGLGSIATVVGSRRTVWAALCGYLAAGLLLLTSAWPGPLAAFLVLPYVVNLVPFLRIDDDSCETANRGWKRFLWINYVVGFAVTMLLIYSAWD